MSTISTLLDLYKENKDWKQEYFKVDDKYRQLCDLTEESKDKECLDFLFEQVSAIDLSDSTSDTNIIDDSNVDSNVDSDLGYQHLKIVAFDNGYSWIASQIPDSNIVDESLGTLPTCLATKLSLEMGFDIDGLLDMLFINLAGFLAKDSGVVEQQRGIAALSLMMMHDVDNE